MCVWRGGWKKTVVKGRRLIMLTPNAFSPGHATVEQARWPAMKVHDGMKAPRQQPRRKRQFGRTSQNFIDIWIGIKAVGEPRLHKNRDAEFRKLRLQRANGRRQQQAIAHGTQSNEKNAGLRGETMEKLFSYHRSQRLSMAAPCRACIRSRSCRIASVHRYAASFLPAGPPCLVFDLGLVDQHDRNVIANRIHSAALRAFQTIAVFREIHLYLA